MEISFIETNLKQYIHVNQTSNVSSTLEVFCLKKEIFSKKFKKVLFIELDFNRIN